eukprot:13331787-Ditylum_brightwellii.AAC.1
MFKSKAFALLFLLSVGSSSEFVLHDKAVTTSSSAAFALKHAKPQTISPLSHSIHKSCLFIVPSTKEEEEEAEAARVNTELQHNKCQSALTTQNKGGGHDDSGF